MTLNLILMNLTFTNEKVIEMYKIIFFIVAAIIIESVLRPIFPALNFTLVILEHLIKVGAFLAIVYIAWLYISSWLETWWRNL